MPGNNYSGRGHGHTVCSPVLSPGGAPARFLRPTGGTPVIPSTARRVPDNTADRVNECIREQTRANVERVAARGPAAIDRRLRELDEEWDIERYVETLAPSLTLLGMTLGLTVSRKFFLVPFAVQGFFLQHALQGWCPPVPVLRRLGVRTQAEIDHERYALKALRGDFRNVTGPGSATQAVAAAGR